MTKVIYTYTAPNGAVINNIVSYPELQALIEKQGGHYQIEYKKIPPKHTALSPKRQAYLKAKFNF